MENKSALVVDEVDESKDIMEIEQIVYDEIPQLKRVSSGSRSKAKKWENIINDSGYFKNTVYTEISFDEEIPKDRYIGAWKSVNDIRVQAGEDGFKRIISNIKDKLKSFDLIQVPYKNTAWTAQKIN